MRFMVCAHAQLFGSLRLPGLLLPQPCFLTFGPCASGFVALAACSMLLMPLQRVASEGKVNLLCLVVGQVAQQRSWWATALQFAQFMETTVYVYMRVCKGKILSCLLVPAKRLKNSDA